MLDLNDKNISYLLISPENKNNSITENQFSCNKLLNILYSKDYTIVPVTSYLEGNYEKSFIAFNKNDNDTLRSDSFYLLSEFNQDSIFIKYNNESIVNKISDDGSEIPMSVILYDSDINNKTYLYNGISFSFLEEKRYSFPSKKEDLKIGMIIEYLNVNKWVEKKIYNVDSEYDNMFKLLIKYKKLRIPY